MRQPGQVTLLALAAGCAAILTLAVPTGAGQDPAVTLQRAVQLETVDGNLPAAIEQYKQVIKNNGGSRGLAARALLRLGGCYEKLGREEARKTYQQLISDYPEQQAEVAAAKEKLARLGQEAAATTETPRFRKIHIPISLASRTFGAQLSPDGKALAFVSGGAVWVVPIQGNVDPNVAGEPEKLTPSISAHGVGLAWSGDSRWIAFNAGGKDIDQIYVVPAQGGEPRKLGVQPVRGGHAYNYHLSLSPDAQHLAFAAKEADALHVNTIAVAGGVPTRLTDATTREPAFSPDGRRIAYVKQYPLGPWSIRSEVRVIPAGGGPSVLVTSVPNRARSPVWSPDGNMIAFLIEPQQNNFSQELWIVPVSDQGQATAEPTPIKLPRETYERLAGWTADGKIGLFFSSPLRQAIYTVPASGGKATQVTPAAAVFHPRWSPDGKRIWFRAPYPEMAIGSVPASGGEVTTVKTGTVQEAIPGGGNAISPDGKTIIFSGYAKNVPGVHLWRMPLAGGEPVRLVESSGQDRFPSWCSDGNLVAFLRGEQTAEKRYVSNILAVPAAGGEVRRITSNSDAVFYAGIACSPDGRSVAYFAEDNTLRIKPVAGGPHRVITKVDGVWNHSEISWSPDGTKLAYSVKGKLWTVPLANDNPAEVETGLDARITNLSWSPDGGKIAFQANQGGEPELWLMENFLPGKGDSGRTMTVRLLWSAPDADTSGEVSPDGRYLGYVDWVKGGDLAVRDLTTGQVRTLTNKGGWDKSGDFALNPRWSPDGKRLAYAWSVNPYQKQLEDQAELRITDPAGEGMRVLHRSKTYLLPAGWFPDGQSILAVASAKDAAGGIVRVSAADGNIKMLRPFEWRSPTSRVCLSPDGKYIAFEFEAEPESLNKDVFLMPADGGAQTPLASGPYDERLLAWTPDGRHVLFSSNRSGTYDAWRVRVENGKAAGAPELLKQDFGMVGPIGFSHDGKFYFGREVILHDILVAGWDPETAKPTSTPQKATEHFAGSTCRPAWSPDGKKLAYVVHRGSLARWTDNQVRIRDLATAQERAVPKVGGAVRSLAWSPDGVSLLICGSPQAARRICQIVDSNSGNVLREVAAAQGSEIPTNAVPAPDGSAVYYATWAMNEGRGRIVRRDLRTNQEKALYSLDRFHNPIYLDVSPDGTQLAFSLMALMEGNKVLDPRIMLISTSGGEARELARIDFSPDTISWSRDSRYVYFSRRLAERKANQLCRVPVSGGAPEELDFEIKGLSLVLTQLRLRPDGRQIAFMQVSRRDNEIWVMENFLPTDKAGR